MSIVLQNISKRYGNQWVVDNISLEVADRELFVLLGSSGSGKSTILRMIAGLVEPTGGRIMLHGRDVTLLAPQERGTGFVFQNYSIFRHMSVVDNIEFGLKIRKIAKVERKRKREELLDMVGLAGLGNRYAHQLSGGQQQRVALARAIAYEPKVLLLDEPFGALDVKIRAQLRRNLKEIQQRLGVTAILVTHDQEEAFELADRIGIIERGRLLETGAPESLYARPRSLFAASFLGSGTVLVGRAEQGRARFGHIMLSIPDEVPHDEGARVQLLFRPEQVMLTDRSPPTDSIVLGKGTVIDQTFTGPSRRARFRLPRLEGTRQLAPPPPFGEESLLIEALLPAELSLESPNFWVSLNGWRILEQPRPQVLIYDSGHGPTSVLSFGQAIAGKLGAQTTVVAVAETADAAERLRIKLHERSQQAGLVDTHLRVRFGRTVEQLAAEQAETIYEMILLGPRSHLPSSSSSRVQRLGGLRSRARSLGNTVISVLRDAEIPVLIARGERTRINRILICTAAGEPGKSDVTVGGRLARRTGAQATLLHVTRNPIGRDELTRSHLDYAAATLRALDVSAEVRIRQAATPAAGILQEAGAGDFDLIVIGCAGPRTRSFLEMNEVMLRVLSDADRPVLIVPTDRV